MKVKEYYLDIFESEEESGIMYEEKLFQFFGYSHLPEHLQKISKPFHDLAQSIEEEEVNE